MSYLVSHCVIRSLHHYLAAPIQHFRLNNVPSVVFSFIYFFQYVKERYPISYDILHYILSFSGNGGCGGE